MEFRKVSLDNLSRLSEMFKLCLNREVDESYFVWKYKNNPSGEVVAFEAVEGDTIAAFYGVIPERYCIGGKEQIVYQSMDTMTHPKFQKRGLFVTLAKMTYEYLKQQNGNIYLVGIPGGNSFHGFVNKMDWKNIHNFKYAFLPRLVAPIVRLFNKSSLYDFSNAHRGDDELNSFLSHYDWKSVSKIRPIIDADIFDWKVWQHPYKDFCVVKIRENNQLMGYCIYSLDEQGYIKIEHLECIEPPNKILVVALCQFILKQHKRANFVYTWFPNDQNRTKAYKAAGFLKNEFNKGLFSYSIPFITYANEPELFDKNWHCIEDFDIQPLLQD